MHPAAWLSAPGARQLGPVLVLGFGVLACTRPEAPFGHDSSVVAPPTDAALPPANVPDAHASLTQINGQSFPDHVLALTWDDGPDQGSVALAAYLHRQKVSATFFVVREWSPGLSSDPGEGTGVYTTGYQHLPILGQLVSLGHRLGNHTLHHVLLSEVSPAQADAEVRGNQEQLDPFLTNELRLLRAPGGAWSAGAADAIAADPYLAHLVGPIRWDIDRKDWDASLGGVTASVTAQRYIESIDEAKHGIVLLHDRVGRVGSTYALEVARILVPALEARGYVFAAPVLGFSPLVVRAPPARALRSIRIADLDGDGRADLSVSDSSGTACTRSVVVPGTAADLRPRTLFQGSIPCTPHAGDATTLHADLNGDGRADLCERSASSVTCELSTGAGFAAATVWLDGLTPEHTSLQLADVNGDGRADLCADSPDGVVCGLAP
jgi:peptidoglycan/xylan/chitin deacetylase (PgdA/CDA1 family)